MRTNLNHGATGPSSLVRNAHINVFMIVRNVVVYNTMKQQQQFNKLLHVTCIWPWRRCFLFLATYGHISCCEFYK